MAKYLARIERTYLYEILIEAENDDSAWRKGQEVCLAGLEGIESGCELFDVEEVKEEPSQDE